MIKISVLGAKDLSSDDKHYVTIMRNRIHFLFYQWVYSPYFVQKPSGKIETYPREI